MSKKRLLIRYEKVFRFANKIKSGATELLIYMQKRQNASLDIDNIAMKNHGKKKD